MSQSAGVSYARHWGFTARQISSTFKWLGALLGLGSFVFGIYQFYQSNLDKKRERAITQVERFQQFAASEQARAIARASDKGAAKAYDLLKFQDSSSEHSRALLNYFNLAESIS